MEDQGTFPQAGAAVPEIPGFQASGPAEISGSVLVWDAVQLSLERPVRIMAPVPGDEESSAAFRRIAALARSVARIGSGSAAARPTGLGCSRGASCSACSSSRQKTRMFG